ncbi:MAG: BA14K family protein [Hyphomicrobiales bacterium]
MQAARWPRLGYGHDDRVAYCKPRFRSYDPASSTCFGYDGRRHVCP